MTDPTPAIDIITRRAEADCEAAGIDTNSPVAILRRARARIAAVAQWTSRALARDAAGEEVEPEDSSATCWCAEGAVRVEAGIESHHVYGAAWEFLVAAATERLRAPCVVNDELGHAAALEMFDRAITLATLGAGK